MHLLPSSTRSVSKCKMLVYAFGEQMSDRNASLSPGPWMLSTVAGLAEPGPVDALNGRGLSLDRPPADLTINP